MFEKIIESLQYSFMIKALFVGILVAISSACLGTFLVLKKYSMIGDGLAHVSFASVAIAVFLGWAPLTISIPIVILASFLILKLTEKAEIHADAAIGLLSSFSVAVGVMLINLKGLNIDIDTYLFGDILTLGNMDVILSIITSLVTVFVIVFFYHSFFSITYDEEFAKVSGTNTKLINTLLSILTSVTIVVGIRIVGTMLITSMIIFPTVTALQVAKGFKQTIMYAIIISIISVILGVFTSLFRFPTGSTIVMYNGIFFLGFFLYKRFVLSK